MTAKPWGSARQPVEQEAHRLLRELLSAIRAHQSHVEQSAGLPAASVRLLMVVRGHPRCTVGECARHLGLSVPTVSNLLRGLARRRWIQLIADRSDGRRVRLKVTAAGTARLRGTIPFAGGMLPAVIASLDDSTLRAVVAGLRSLLAAIPPEYRGADSPRAVSREAGAAAARGQTAIPPRPPIRRARAA